MSMVTMATVYEWEVLSVGYPHHAALKQLLEAHEARGFEVYAIHIHPKGDYVVIFRKAKTT